MVIRPADNRTLVENIIRNRTVEQEQSKILKEQQEQKHKAEVNRKAAIARRSQLRESRINRKSSFATSVKAGYLTDALSYVVESSLSRDITNRLPDAYNVARSLVTDYVNNVGAGDILRKMSYSGPYMHKVSNIVNEAYKRVMKENEDCSVTDLSVPGCVTKDMNKELEGVDSDNVTDQIREKVTSSIQDWIYQNAEEKEEIKDALDATNAKIEEHKDDGEEVQESYANIGKQKIAKIRNRQHGLFHNMVMGMCESVIKNPKLHERFMEDGKLNMDKIVGNCEVAYTFMEALASLRLVNRDEIAKDIMNDIKSARY